MEELRKRRVSQELDMVNVLTHECIAKRLEHKQPYVTSFLYTVCILWNCFGQMGFFLNAALTTLKSPWTASLLYSYISTILANNLAGKLWQKYECLLRFKSFPISVCLSCMWMQWFARLCGSLEGAFHGCRVVGHLFGCQAAEMTYKECCWCW